MPDNKLNPDNPQYYTKPERYPVMELLATDSYVPTDPEELKVYKENAENLKAFLASQMLQLPEEQAQVKDILSKVPGYRKADPQRDARRQLSEMAREKILNFSFNYRLAGEGFGLDEREYGLLLRHDDPEKDRAYNETVANTLSNGKAEDRGRLFDALIGSCKPLAEKLIKGMSDRELVENLHIFQKVQLLAINADNIRNLEKNQKIKLSDTSKEILKYLDDQSLRINLALHRVNAIANPTYEHIDIDGFLGLNAYQFGELDTASDSNFTCLWEYLQLVNRARGDDQLINQANRNQMKDALDAVTQANKGFFIGSRAYRSAFKSARAVTKLMERLGDHPSLEAREQAKPILKETIQKCQAYLNSKKIGQMNAREQIRYAAMQRMIASCQANLEYYEMQDRIKKSEELSFNRPAVDVKYPEYSHDQVQQKINDAYGAKRMVNGKEVDGTIPASNYGTALDDLREEIHKDLTRMLSKNGLFNDKLGRNVVAKMVVLDMAKRDRYKNRLNETEGGSLERQLAEKHDDVIKSFENNTYIKRFIADMNPQMLRHFVMEEGARTITNNMLRMVQQVQSSVKTEPTAQLTKQHVRGK